MKITNEQLQKIIHEELQEAVRRGEITEEELKQLQEGPLKWAKGVGQDLGSAVDFFKAQRGARQMADLNAKADAADSNKVKIGNVGGRDVYDTKRPGDPGFVAAKGSTPTTATSKATTSVTAPAAANAPKDTTPAAATPSADGAKTPTTPTAATWLGTGKEGTKNASEATSIWQTPEAQNLTKSFATLSNVLATSNRQDLADTLVGFVIGKTPQNRLGFFPAENPAAQNAIKSRMAQAKEAPSIPATPESQVSAPQTRRNVVIPGVNDQNQNRPFIPKMAITESKNPSYQETYNKWQKLIKG